MAEVTDTAAAIARLRAAESELPASERLFEDPFARLFDGGPAGEEALAKFLRVPFFRESIRLRTRFIDDCVRTALADGIRQLVILGAGFDCRALRLDAIAAAGARVFEVDLAPQLENKRAILAAAGVTLPAFVHLVACDFTAGDFASGLDTELRQLDFASSAATLVLCEGVIGYLTDPDADRTLRWMATCGGSTRAVFNYGNLIDPAKMAARLRAAGFRSHEDHALSELYERYLPGTPPPGGEIQHLVIARA